jgi:hypothetical protein
VNLLLIVLGIIAVLSPLDIHRRAGVLRRRLEEGGEQVRRVAPLLGRQALALVYLVTVGGGVLLIVIGATQ